MRLRLLGFVVIAATLLSACGRGERLSGKSNASTHFQGMIAPGQAVSLEVAATIGADISVLGTSGRDIRLDPVPADGFSGVKLATSNDPQRLRLRLDLAASQQQRFRWLFGHHANATITLSVPRDSAVSIHAVNGPVRVDGVHGPLAVRIVNGLIDVKGAGSILSLRAVNGSIDAGISDLSRTPNVDIAGTNGSIDVTVPHGFKARVNAHSAWPIGTERQ